MDDVLGQRGVRGSGVREGWIPIEGEDAKFASGER